MNRRTAVISTLNEIARRPFSYGEMDCCQVAARVIQSYTGQDYSSELPYEDEDGANLILEKHGGLSGLFTYLFGDSICSSFEIGDPVLVHVNGIKLIGIYMDNFVACKTTRGILSVCRNNIQEGWHVG